MKNEEEVLGRCLDCVSHLVEKIIIVDTGSKDGTKSGARQYISKIVDFAWIDDFAAARNASFEQATQDYIFWLDADDVRGEQAQEAFLQLNQMLALQTNAVTMPYYLAFEEYGRVSFFWAATAS